MTPGIQGSAFCVHGSDCERHSTKYLQTSTYMTRKGYKDAFFHIFMWFYRVHVISLRSHPQHGYLFILQYSQLLLLQSFHLALVWLVDVRHLVPRWPLLSTHLAAGTRWLVQVRTQRAGPAHLHTDTHATVRLLSDVHGHIYSTQS